jgi:hypothetical protein
VFFFKFGVEVGVEESIVSAPLDYNFVVKSNLTFCVFLICSLKNQSFLRRVVHQRFNSNLTFPLFVFNLQFEKPVFLRLYLGQPTDIVIKKGDVA